MGLGHPTSGQDMHHSILHFTPFLPLLFSYKQPINQSIKGERNWTKMRRYSEIDRCERTRPWRGVAEPHSARQTAGQAASTWAHPSPSHRGWVGLPRTFLIPFTFLQNQHLTSVCKHVLPPWKSAAPILSAKEFLLAYKTPDGKPNRHKLWFLSGGEFLPNNCVPIFFVSYEN